MGQVVQKLSIEFALSKEELQQLLACNVKSMNCFKFQKENQQYLQNNHQQYRQLVQKVTAILSLHSSHLTDSQPSTFYQYLTQKIISKSQRRDNLLKTATTYFSMPPQYQFNHIQQFHRFLLKFSHVPHTIIFQFKVISLLHHLSLSSDIAAAYQECKKIREEIQMNYKWSNMSHKKQQKYFHEKIRSEKMKSQQVSLRENEQDQMSIKFVYWRVEGCLIILSLILNRQLVNKNQAIIYLRISKEILKNRIVKDHKVLETFHWILSLLQKQNQRPDIIRYFQIQYKTLYNKINMKRKENQDENNIQIFSKFLSINKKQEISEQLAYIQSDERQKVQNRLNEHEQSRKNRLRIDQSLSYFIFKKRQSFKRLSKRKQESSVSKTVRSVHKSCRADKSKENILDSRRPFRSGRITRNSIREKIINMRQIEQEKKQSNFSQKQEESNLYTKLFKVTEKEKHINFEQLENEADNFLELQIEKPAPQMSEILLGEQSINQQGLKNNVSTLSFNGVSNSQAYFSFSINLNFIHCFSREIIYLSIYTSPKSGACSLNFTSYNNKIYNQPLILGNKYEFSFPEIKRYINLSQFYFQLIQEKIENDIDLGDIQKISHSISGEPHEKSAPLLVCLSRMGRALAFWYFTKAMKMNGNILAKREIPTISDPLKFSIALEFLKKYDREVCLEKIGESRNKTAIYECFRYLFYGRKIICKGMLNNEGKHSFFTLSLEKMTEDNFIIAPGSSHFSNLKFTFSKHSLQNEHIDKKQYSLDSYLSKKRLTLFILDNITDNYLSPQILKIILDEILKKQNNSLFHRKRDSLDGYLLNKNTHQNLKVIQNDQNNVLYVDYKCSHKIYNFLPPISYYQQIFSKGNDLKIVHQCKFTHFIPERGYLFCCEFQLKCRIKIGIVDEMKKCGAASRSIYFYDDLKEENERIQLIKSPYYNKLTKVKNIADFNENTFKTLNIHRNLIQKSRKNNLEIIFKNVIKQDSKFYYVSVNWHKELRIYRVDIYDPTTSKCYMTYFDKKCYMKNCQVKQKWGEYLRRGKIWVNLMGKSLRVDSDVYQLFQTFGILHNFEKESMNKGTIQLVEAGKNRLYCLIILEPFTHQFCTFSKLSIHEVQDSPLAYNTNLFADFARKQYSINLYNDMFLRLYFKFIGWPGLPHYDLPSINDLYQL